MSNYFYTDLQVDCLRELTNIGGGNAATSISQLIEKPVDMSVPTIDILNYEEVYSDIMAEDKVITSVIMEMSGDAEGVFIYMLEEDTIGKLLKMMLPSGTEMTEEIEESVLKELVNILVSSFLRSIGEFLHIELLATVPVLSVDMFGAILSSVYIETGQFDENLMIIKTEFSYFGEKIESSLYFVPTPGVLDELFEKIGL